MEKDDAFGLRLELPNRTQKRFVPNDLDSMLAEDHQARAVWAYVEQLDLSPFYATIKSRRGLPGRPAIDPRILMALWMYATADGVGAAREIERLSVEHIAYQWICGGVSVNYHSLSDFRSLSVDKFNYVLSESIGVLIAEGLVELRSVAHDGMKVRASAGASSFRTRQRLKTYVKMAREQVERLEAEIDADPSASRRRREARQLSAAESRNKRIERAIKLTASRKERKKSNNGKKKTAVRVSTTDPDCHIMKMSDGGYRPAYNAHMVTDVDSRFIVSYDVNDDGTDRKMMVPLIDRIENTYQRTPSKWLADGGCNSHENVITLDGKQCDVYAPPMKRRSGRARNSTVKTDTPEIKRWRRRMSTKQGKAIYRLRASVAEWVNAGMRNNGLRQFLVRGLERVKSVVVLHILTLNMCRRFATPIP